MIWTLRRWWVLLWKDFGWFQVELSIFDFSSNFTGPDLQKIFRSRTITVHVSYPSKKVSNQAEIYQEFIKIVSITLEGLWMVSDRIVDFQFFVKFHRSGPAKFFSFRTIMEQVSYQSKRFLIKPRLIWTSRRRWVLLWKDFGWFQIELLIFNFSSNFTGPDLKKIFSFWTITEQVSYQSKKVPNQAKIDLDFKKMVSITLEEFWMVSDRIVDFQFFVKFHRSGPAKILSFRTITEEVSYQSKKVPNQAKIDLDFNNMVSITLEGLWMVEDRIGWFSIFRHISQVRTCKNFPFLNYYGAC